MRHPAPSCRRFDPVRGTGLYLMTQDLDARSKFYHAQKTAGGARLAVEYTPLQDTRLPRTVVGCNQGVWHEQLARYQQWVGTWYRPAGRQDLLDALQHELPYRIGRGHRGGARRRSSVPR